MFFTNLIFFIFEGQNPWHRAYEFVILLSKQLKAS